MSRWSEEVLTSLELPKRFEDKIRHDMDYLLSLGLGQMKQIILFGSCARREMRVTSDVDLLVIVDEQIGRAQRGEICSELEEPMDQVHTDVIFYTQEQYEASTRIFTKQVKQDGIILYERS